MGTDDERQSPAARAAARLKAAKHAIIARWEERVRGDERHPEADRQSTPALHDHLPQLLDQLVTRLLEQGGREPLATIQCAPPVSRVHAQQRLRQGYDISAVLRELAHLRATIVEALDVGDGPGFEPACRSVIDGAIDEVMIRAAAEFERLSSMDLHREASFRERFIAILGHDLRQPLSTMLMGADMLASVPGAGPLAERIGRSARRMEAMVRELLDFSVVRQDGALILTRIPLDLRSIVTEVIGELELAHPEAELELDAPESQHGLWDHVRLLQVVSNLIGNALEHGAEDRPVRIALRGDEAEVVLAISNENRGPPLAPQLIERLFEPFESGRPSAGLGLGLFIACQVVRGHGGRIEVTSDEAGTTFRVHLPRR